MKKNKIIYIYTMIGLSICLTIIEILLNSQGKEVSNSTALLWSLIFIVLSILWANSDIDSTDLEKPFDFGFLIYILWPIAFPWYLIKTRGFKGILLYTGFILVWQGPSAAGAVTYALLIS